MLYRLHLANVPEPVSIRTEDDLVDVWQKAKAKLGHSDHSNRGRYFAHAPFTVQIDAGTVGFDAAAVVAVIPSIN